MLLRVTRIGEERVCHVGSTGKKQGRIMIMRYEAMMKTCPQVLLAEMKSPSFSLPELGESKGGLTMYKLARNNFFND